MILRAITDSLIDSLRPLYGANEARSIAQMVVQRLYGVSRVDMALDPLLQAADKVDWRGVQSELVVGRPVQYVLGVAEFCGLEFAVREGVLIPREETAELVDWVVEEMKDDQIRVLDVGTGSGCIAIAMADALPMAEVWAMDISHMALEIAAENARRLGVNVHFVCEDALSAVDMWSSQMPVGQFDVVVSNPPYVPQSDREQMHINVIKYEPEGALFVPDDDILLFYRAIASHSQTLLRSGGWLYFEIYEKASQQVCEMLTQMGFVDITARQDIHARQRMVRCRII